MPVNRDYPTEVPKDATFDNSKRWAKEDATTGSDDKKKIGPNGIVLEKFKDIRSIPAGAHAPATGHIGHKK